MHALSKPLRGRCAISAAVALLAACGSSSPGSAPPGIDATGTWFGTLQSTSTAETASLVLDLKQQGAAVSVKMEIWSGTFNIGMPMSGQMSAFTVTLRDQDALVTFSGVVGPDFTASGEYTLSSDTGTNRGTWTAHRIPSIAMVSQQRFSMTGEATAMTFDGTDLWVSGYGACGATYVGFCKMKPDGTYSGVPSPSPPDACGGSMAYDGAHLWCTRGGAGVSTRDVYLVSPADGSTSSQTLGPADHLAVAFDSQSRTMRCAYQWPLRSRFSAIGDTGAVTTTVDLPIYSPVSLAWDGSAFWLADWYPPKLYKLDQNGNVLGAADPPPMDPADYSQTLSALAYDGSHLLAAVSTSNPSGNRAVVYNMTPQ